MSSYPLVPIREIARIHYGKALKAEDRVKSGSVPVFGSSGQIGFHNESLVEYPTLIVGRKGSVGQVTYANKGGWAIDTVFYTEFIKPNEVDLRFFFYALKRSRLERWTITTSIPGLSRDDFYTTQIPLPPLDEQCRIAAILDKADAVRRKRQEAIALTEELLRSAFLEMFGDPITNPKGWEVKPLGKVASVNRGKFTPRPRNDPQFYDGIHPFIQTGDIAAANGYLTEYHQTLNDLGAGVSRFFKPGTIVIAIVGATIGETAILSKEMYCPDSVVGIEPNNSYLCAEYVEYSLRWWKDIFRAQAPETARANINLETLRPLQIALPPSKMQKVFQEMYRRVHAEKYQEKLVLYDDLFNSLLQRAFCGEL